MEEIEVKFLEVDKDAIIKKLEQLGAKKKFEGDVETEVYDFPQGRLAGAGKTLRLRTLGNRCILTLKKGIKKEDAKVMDEHEVTIDNIEEMRSILLMLGLRSKGKPSKTRVSYSYDGASFEFDKFENVPTFLEIEGKSVEHISELASKLGLDMKDAKPWGGRDVLKHYKKLRFGSQQQKQNSQ